ncbi:MAG TPA: hypothetical protein PLO53_00695 [Candidatus Hydrogenedentes bacterium]|nr:hypothetical protein [Candidatus Hydrogenedentota bacterium]HPU96452.1 hypothetical protein [Candidatus Hydrogenedentota bacterium]
MNDSDLSPPKTPDNRRQNLPAILPDLVRHLQKIDSLFQTALAATVEAGSSISGSVSIEEQMNRLEIQWSQTSVDIEKHLNAVNRLLEISQGSQTDGAVQLPNELRHSLDRIRELARQFDLERDRVLDILAVSLREETARLKQHAEVLRRYQHQSPPSDRGWKT